MTNITNVSLPRMHLLASCCSSFSCQAHSSCPSSSSQFTQPSSLDDDNDSLPPPGSLKMVCLLFCVLFHFLFCDIKVTSMILIPRFSTFTGTMDGDCKSLHSQEQG